MQHLLSENIKQYREAAQLSQEELARKLHISRQAISNWERGISEPDIQMLQELAHYLHVDVCFLIGEAKQKDDSIELQKSLSHRYFALLAILCICLLYFSSKGQYHTLIPLLMLFLITSTIVCSFGHSMKTNDFSMLAGYDCSIDYRVDIVKHMLLNIQQHVLMTAFAIAALLFFLSFTSYWKVASLLLTLFYSIDFIFAILFLNHRYQKQMFMHVKDYETAKRASLSIYVFLLLLFVFVGVIALLFTIYDIHNNTKEALLTFAGLLPYMIASIVYLFYENHNAKKEHYHMLNKCFWLTILICLFSVIGTWILCSHY